jgi:CheY-like chemotaxis protein
MMIGGVYAVYKETDMTDEKPLLLIVDDEAVIIKILVSILKKQYQLGVAKNGVQALEYIEHNIPDLILLDLQMPEMDGFEVCSRLKADTRTKNIPIIFLSGMSKDEDTSQAQNMGVVDFIYKPFDAMEIMESIKKYMS